MLEKRCQSLGCGSHMTTQKHIAATGACCPQPRSHSGQQDSVCPSRVPQGQQPLLDTVPLPGWAHLWRVLWGTLQRPQPPGGRQAGTNPAGRLQSQGQTTTGTQKRQLGHGDSPLLSMSRSTPDSRPGVGKRNSRTLRRPKWPRPSSTRRLGSRAAPPAQLREARARRPWQCQSTRQWWSLGQRGGRGPWGGACGQQGSSAG